MNLKNQWALCGMCGASRYAFHAPWSLQGGDPPEPREFVLCLQCDMSTMPQLDNYGRVMGTSIVGPPRLLTILRTGAPE